MISDAKANYERWWKGKLCRPVWQTYPHKRVTEVKVYGPPSFVYGVAFLVFEDGTDTSIPHGNAFKPRKCDVEVLEEKVEQTGPGPV